VFYSQSHLKLWVTVYIVMYYLVYTIGMGS